MSIFKANLTLLNKFLKNFTPGFTKKQMAIFILVVYALFKDYKRNSLEAMARSTNTNYQKLQYFMSDSKWDLPAIKQKRLEIIQKQRTTASTKDGSLAIDDTGCPKPFAKKTRQMATLWTSEKRRNLQCCCRFCLCLTNKTLSH